MEIKIKINKKTAEHLCSPHTFYDCCGEAEDVLLKVQKQIDNQKLFKLNNIERSVKNGDNN